MKPLHVSAAVLLSLVVTVSAFDLETRGGRTYKNIRLREKTALGIKIAHEGGVVWLDYSEIPVPHLWTFGYVEADYNAAKRAASGEPAQGTSATTRTTRLYQSGATAAPTLQRPARALSSSSPVSSTRVNPGDPALPSQSREPQPILADRSAPRGGGASLSGTARGQCVAITKKGFQCSRMASGGSSYCWQHP